MFVVNFNEKVTLGLPDAIPFTNRPEELGARDLPTHLPPARRRFTTRSSRRGSDCRRAARTRKC